MEKYKTVSEFKQLTEKEQWEYVYSVKECGNRSGDLEVYEGKRPDRNDMKYYTNTVFDLSFYLWDEATWLSTKQSVKMAEGERHKLIDHLGLWNKDVPRPIDVSDIVDIRDGLGYFKEPVTVDGAYSDLIDLVVKNYGKSKGEVINIIQEHFEIKRK